MAWLDDRWRYRLPVSVVIPTGTANGNALIGCYLPQIDHLWEHISSLNDLRFTLPDGVTELGHEEIGDLFSVVNRTGAVTFGGFPTAGGQGGIALCHMYYGPEQGWDPGAPDDVPASEGISIQATIDEGSPSTHLFVMQPPTPRATRPRRPLGKLAGDDLFVWIDPTSLLEPANGARQGRRVWEEPALTRVTVYDDADPPADVTATMTDPEDMAWVVYQAGRQSRYALRVRIKPSSVGNFTVVPRFTTSTPDPTGGTAINTHRDLGDAIGVRVVSPRET